VGRWPLQRIAGWALIGLGIVAFVVAGDVRTNWVIGDLAPELGEVALPRLGSIAAMVGLALLAWHQVRARRSLPEDRYRGPSILVLFAIAVGLAVFVVLPVRQSINLLFEGGVPDLTSVLFWQLGPALSLLVLSVLVLRTAALSRLRLFADARPVHHVMIGIGVGAATQIGVLAVAQLLERLTPGPVFQTWGEGLEILVPPGVPVLVAIAASVVLAPLAEEVFYRGLALNAWLREYGVWPALIGSALLFGLAHYGLNPIEYFADDVPRLALLSAGGLVLGLLAVRTGSLIAPIAAHATMNGLIFLIGLAAL
jgi:membrane protease YdiL (CAAX protease family)